MKVACVILAAGAGQRMGGRNKALLLWSGETFIERIARLGDEVGVQECVVVVGQPHKIATETAARVIELPCVVNSRSEAGMASSVATGFAHALQTFKADACWLWPVDAPGIKLSTLAELMPYANTERIVTPRFAGRGGHPSLVGREIWQELADCESEPKGARSVFRRQVERRLFVDVDDPAIRHDVDRPDDLENLPC